MDKIKNEVPFDPGYAPLVMEYLGQVGIIYYMFCAPSDVRIKRANFPLISQKLEKCLKKNAAFYLGCLLWASYISQFKDCKIEGNKLLGEDCTQEEYTSEIGFLIDFVKNKYPRDYKYYKNKIWQTDKRFAQILETYRNFLILNKGFCACSNTNQIILPDNIKEQNSKTRENIHKTIQKALSLGDIEVLFEAFEILF